MRGLKILLNKNGLTLIELIAAITILSIVIISFLSFFSQYIMFSTKVEDKLTAVNIAEKVLNTVKEDEPTMDYDPYPYELPEVNGKVYYPVIVKSQSQDEQALGLQRVHVKIYSKEDYGPNTNPDSEIYGYIEQED